MRWTTRKRQDLTVWHRWFAWYPVRVGPMSNLGGNTWVWLVTIERMLVVLSWVGFVKREIR